MNAETPSDELRAAIKKIGVANVSRMSGVSATTLYSFCSDDRDNRTENLRSDNERAVRKALGLDYATDGDAAEVIDIWDRIPLRDRGSAKRMLEGLAEPKRGKSKGEND